MIRDVQRLRNDASLHGEVAALARAEPLVDAPTDRAMVEDDVIASAGAAAVLRDAALVAHPDAHVPDDDVVRARATEGVVFDADAVARCGLPGDREVRVADDQLRLQVDRATDREDDGARPRCFNRLAQRSRTGVFETG